MENKKNYGYTTHSYGSSKRKEIKFLAIGFLIACVIFAIALACWVATNQDNKISALEINYNIDYVYHIVEPGDSISYIAGIYIGDYPGSFAEYQSLICSKNNIINADRIMDGDVLQIPVFTEIVVEKVE